MHVRPPGPRTHHSRRADTSTSRCEPYSLTSWDMASEPLQHMIRAPSSRAPPCGSAAPGRPTCRARPAPAPAQLLPAPAAAACLPRCCRSWHAAARVRPRLRHRTGAGSAAPLRAQLACWRGCVRRARAPPQQAAQRAGPCLAAVSALLWAIRSSSPSGTGQGVRGPSLAAPRPAGWAFRSRARPELAAC